MTDRSTEEREQVTQGEAVATDAALAEPDAIVSAPKTKSGRRTKALKTVANLLHDLAIAVVICFLLITYLVQAFRVQGMSMSPELIDGERILVNKFLYHFRPIERGDVVVFWYPEDPDVSFIKRVVALPRDRIEIIAGRVYVNDEPVEELYVASSNADDRSYPPRDVRPGHYFVLGDNRHGSNDSRSWGFVPHRYIYGKAFLRIWPLDKLGIID
jgi:signal peptidase I